MKKDIPVIAHLTQICVYIYIYLNMLQLKKKYGTLQNISLKSWSNHRCLKNSSIPQKKLNWRNWHTGFKESTAKSSRSYAVHIL